MRLIIATISAGIAIGFLAGGRLMRLARTPLRWRFAAVAGIGLQFAPGISGWIGSEGLLGSFGLLLAFAVANVRRAGFALVLLGLALNATVIAVDHGMPVTRQALVASGQAGTLADLRGRGGSKHHLAMWDDLLLPLSDQIPIGPPIRQAISLGDIATHAGVLWFVVAGMRRREVAAGAEPEGAAPVDTGASQDGGPGWRSRWRRVGVARR